MYTATTTQFSSFNMDVLRTDQSCLVIDGTGIKKDYRLQVDYVYNDRSWTKYRYPRVNEIYALYGLPPDILYTLTAFKTDLTDPPIEIDCETCTSGLQDPSFPLNPDPDPNFTFPACHQDNPVTLSAARPDAPTKLCAEYIGCNYIDLYWEGTANGPEEGYIIKVYTYVGDPDPVVYKPSYDDIRLRVEGLNSSTTYYFHIHQYDEYAEEDSEPYPDPDPLAVKTSEPQTFTIINKICDHQITQVYFNGGTDNQLLQDEVINYGIDESHEFSVCQRPDSIQVITEHVNSDPPIAYSFDFENISANSIEVEALVKILPGPNWNTQIITGTTHTLVFQDDETFKFYDENDVQIDYGDYDEDSQDCDKGEISFNIDFDGLGELNAIYISLTEVIRIDVFPGSDDPVIFEKVI